MKKRAELGVTENHGRQTENIDPFFTEILERVTKRSKENPVDEIIEAQEKAEIKKKDSTGVISELPFAYHQCSFDNYIGNDRLVSDLKKLTETDESIVLRGNTGCGKTHLAIAIGKEIKTEYRSGNNYWEIYNPGSVFTTAPELLLKIRSSFREGAQETEEQIISEYSKVQLLILDDIGSEKISEFAIATFYIILDRRIRNLKRTIITTNLSQKEIEEVFGARIASRLASMTNIKINMPDYRKKRS